MEFSSLIKKRHSVRRFDFQKKLSHHQINKLLEAATYAPSEGNLQPWYFIVVENHKIKQSLSQAALGQLPVVEAPVVIVTCIDKNKTMQKYGQRGVDLYAIQSTALATYQLWLAAVDRGMAACWIGAFDENQVSSILKLPEHLRPVVLLCLGYAREEPEVTERESIEKIAKYINEFPI